MARNTIEILLADDHAILRDGIKSLLTTEKDMRVVAEAKDGDQALQKARSLKPNIVIMDISMPNMNGLAAAREILRFVDTKVLLLSMHTDEEYVVRAIHAGVSGYLDKQSAASTLITAVRSVHSGEAFFSPSISKTVLQAALDGISTPTSTRLDHLTKREKQILQLLAEGEKVPGISKKLFVSVSTVYKHRHNLMNKLNLFNLADLTRFAVENKMISK